MYPTPLARLTICTVVIALTIGCDLGKGVTDQIARANQIIDRAIRDIERDSSSWQSALKQVAAELPKDVQETIRVEAAQLAERSIAVTGIEFKCSVDFLANRATQNLQRLKRAITGGEMPPPEAKLCHVSPGSYDLSLDLGRRQTIVIAGYDLDQKDANGDLFQVVLIPEGGGDPIRLPETYIGRTTHYEVTINLAHAEVDHVVYGRGIVKLQLRWKGQPMSAQGEVVVAPRRAQTRTIAPSLGNATFVPSHTGRGDRDFDTDDDEHMDVGIRVETRVADNQLLRNIYMSAHEPRDDWTTAEQESGWQVAYAPPPGWQIQSVTPLGVFENKWQINDHGPVTFSVGNAGMVQSVVIYGDGEGEEAGTKTKVEVEFNPVEIVLQEILPARDPNAQFAAG